MDKSLKRYNLPILNQEETENLNRSINSNKIELVIKKLQRNKSPRPDSFRGEFYQAFKGELTTIHLKLFQNIEEEGMLPDSFYKASINLIPNYRPISLININAKILNKI